MSRIEQHPPGVPCFVDALTDDLPAARRFYEGIFGWEVSGPGAMPTDPPGEYWRPGWAARSWRRRSTPRCSGAPCSPLATAPRSRSASFDFRHADRRFAAARVGRAPGVRQPPAQPGGRRRDDDH